MGLCYTELMTIPSRMFTINLKQPQITSLCLERYNPLPVGGDSSCLLIIALQAVWTLIRLDIKSGLVLVQTVCHSDGIPEKLFENVNANSLDPDQAGHKIRIDLDPNSLSL